MKCAVYTELKFCQVEEFFFPL